MSSAKELGHYVREGLPLARVEELKAAFDLFDRDGTGAIQAADLERVLLELELSGPSSRMYLVLAQMKQNGTPLRFQDFVSLFCDAYPNDFRTLKGCQSLFEALDTDSAGFLTAQKIMDVAQQLGESLGCEEAAEMILRADRDCDGAVNLDDFYRLMCMQNK